MNILHLINKTLFTAICYTVQEELITSIVFLYFATSFAAKIILKIILLYLLLAPSAGSLKTWVESSIFAV